ncbi:MAG: ECF transporter S component [Pelotomaculum sp.]|nr:ECF transporter S component [Pelotomaculum sp.]
MAGLPDYLFKLKFPLFLLAVAGLLAMSISPGSPLARQNWGLLSAEIVFIAIVFLYWGFERSAISSREIAVIAVLGTVAAVGRVPFAALFNIQPVTFLTIITGYVFGARAGFMVGSTAAVVSNFFLGQGPWTPWQMFTWGLAGSSAALFGAVFPQVGRWGMAAFLFTWGYIYGWIMNLWFWTAFIYPLNLQSFLTTYAASFWFDTCHALGNVFFYFFCGTGVVKILKRTKKKLEVSYLPAQDLGTK